MIRKQSHRKGRGSKGTPKTDKKRAHISSVKGEKSTRPAGMEGTVGRGYTVNKPKGTPVVARGGRNSRAKGYAL